MARFRVNGRSIEVDAAPALRLTRALRDHLGLTGTKVGCDAGDCGACTVLLDGAQVCACLVSLGQVEGRSVTTVEGLAENGRLTRLQQAFHEHGAAQCGICTPGMLMAASTLLGRPHPPTEPEVLDALGGVLCRCTGYRKIVRAVLAAANGTSREFVSTPSTSETSGHHRGTAGGTPFAGSCIASLYREPPTGSRMARPRPGTRPPGAVSQDPIGEFPPGAAAAPGAGSGATSSNEPWAAGSRASTASGRSRAGRSSARTRRRTTRCGSGWCVPPTPTPGSRSATAPRCMHGIPG